MLDFENTFAYRAITVSSVAVGIDDGADPADATAAAIPTGARAVTFMVGSYPVNYRPDGTDPTAAQGAPLPAGTVLTVDSSTRHRFIRSTGSDSTVHCLYGR